MRTVDHHEAIDHFQRLHDEVAEGEQITITKDGVPVARLEPVSQPAPASTSNAIAAIRDFRNGRTLGDLSIRDLVDAGRRF